MHNALAVDFIVRAFLCLAAATACGPSRCAYRPRRARRIYTTIHARPDQHAFPPQPDTSRVAEEGRKVSALSKEPNCFNLDDGLARLIRCGKVDGGCDAEVVVGIRI